MARENDASADLLAQHSARRCRRAASSSEVNRLEQDAGVRIYPHTVDSRSVRNIEFPDKSSFLFSESCSDCVPVLHAPQHSLFCEVFRDASPLFPDGKNQRSRNSNQHANTEHDHDVEKIHNQHPRDTTIMSTCSYPIKDNPEGPNRTVTLGTNQPKRWAGGPWGRPLSTTGENSMLARDQRASRPRKTATNRNIEI